MSDRHKLSINIKKNDNSVLIERLDKQATEESKLLNGALTDNEN
jgi:hypothetical protein